MRILITATVLVAACGGESEYAPLFGAPNGSATASLHGTWGGAIQQFDTRWVLAPDRITLANKCGDKIVGLDIAASVSTSEIRILESAMAGDNECFVNAVPGTLTVCPSDQFTPKRNCFDHSGFSLTLYESPIESLALTKLSDEMP